MKIKKRTLWGLARLRRGTWRLLRGLLDGTPIVYPSRRSAAHDRQHGHKIVKLELRVVTEGEQPKSHK